MALAPFVPFFVVIGCLIVAALLTIMTLAFIKALSGAPVVGSWLADKAVAIEHTISNAIGNALSDVDGLVGGAFHHLAHYADNLWHEIDGQAYVLSRLAESLVANSGATAAVRSLAHDLHNAVHYLGGQVGNLARDFHGIEGRVKTLEHDIAKGIGNDLPALERTLKRDVRHIERDLIKPLREAEAFTAGEVGNLFDWIRGKADIIGAGTFAGAVAAVLSLVGLDWIACKSRSSVNGKSGCALWNDLEGLLQVAAIPLEIASLVELIAVAQKVTPDVVSGVENLLDV